jgi:LL-diaminopimelate aminotransferase
MRTADRIAKLPPYLFAEIDRKVGEARAKGVDIISFGVGDPDLPTPPHVVEALTRAAHDPGTHRYPSYTGMAPLREAIAAWYSRRFGVTLDPDVQVQPVVGSKEGIFHLPMAFVDPGDVVLVPDPAYPVYETSTILCGGEAVAMPLLADNDFKPDLGAIPKDALERAKVMWLNYPSNPTAATVDDGFFDEVVAFCVDNDLLLCHDAAYTEITFDGYVAPSALAARDALDCTIEFHSLSKTYNMTGWRIGWAAGSEVAIEAFKRLKTNVDSGIFDAIQIAGIAALEGPQDFLATCIERYRDRRDLLCDGLKSMGVIVDPPRGSIYVWAPVPQGHDSGSYTNFLLDECGIVVAPGTGYGAAGEGFIRFSLTIDDDRLKEGVERMRGVSV